MAKVIVSDTQGEREVALSSDRMSIGRVAQGNDIVIKVPEASRQHCLLLKEGAAWFVEDSGSSNGTRVNGRRVTKFELQDGDEIQVGVAKLRFLESEVADLGSEISLDGPELEDDLDLEISLDESATIRFLNTDQEDETVEITNRLTIGRNSTNDLALTVKGVSGTHAEIVNESGTWLLRDLGSTNGSKVDGEKVNEAPLEPGSRVSIGVAHFAFGIGGDEGEGVSFELDTEPELAAGNEVFAISEKNLKRKEKAAFLVYLVFVAAAGVGIWYWLSQDSGAKGRNAKVETISGNLIGAAATFEPSDDENDEGAFETDSDSLDFIESSRRRNSGSQSLELQAEGGSGVHEIYFVKGLGSVAPSEQFEIGGYFDSAGLDGLCGVGLVWFDRSGRRIGASYLNAPGEEGGFEEIRGVFVAPEGCRSAGFVLTATDATGRCYVDDVFVLRRRADARSGLEVAGFDARLDAAGVFSVARDSAGIATDGSFVTVKRGEEGRVNLDSVARRTVVTSREETAESITVSGRVVTAGESADLSEKLTMRSGGIEFVASIGGQSATHFALEVSIDEGVVSVAKGTALRHADDFERDAVDSLVIGNGARAMRIDFAQPSSISLVSQSNRSYLLFPLDADRRVTLNAQLDFSGEREEVTRLFEAAERADLAESRYGEAMKGYRDIVDRFSYRRDLATRAEQRHTELTAAGEKLLDELRTKAADIAFFGTFAYDYDAFVERASKEVERWEGSDIALEIQTITDTLGKAWGERQSAEKESAARTHLARGKDLMTEGRAMPVLARGFFLSAIALVPESDIADDARRQLEKVKTLQGR